MAGREIKTTLAVDGEQAFKRSIKEAQTSIRNLGTQLTLAQAEFKKDGDAMKLMETRAKALKSEIDAQKEIVKALEGAVKDAAKEYGEGSKEAEKWEAELNRAKATMANLENELTNNNNGLDRTGKAFDTASDKAESFSNAVNSIDRNVSYDTVVNGVGRITGAFENAISKVGELATKMWNLMRDVAEWADDVQTSADMYGISAEEYQRMKYAAKFTDTSVETLAKSQQKFKTALKGGLDNSGLVDTMQALRIPITDKDTGRMREWTDLFWEAGAAIKAMGDDEVAQNDYAMKLFGKSWKELMPLFTTNPGESARERYNNLMEEAPVVSQESIDRLTSLQDQLDRLDSQFEVLKINVLSELAPAFETLAGVLTDLFEQFNEWIQSDDGKEMMASLRDSLTSFFDGVKDIDFSTAVNTVKDAFGTLWTALDWIVKNKDKVWNAIKYIGAGFGLLKIGEFSLIGAMTVGGMKNIVGKIFHGGSNAATQAAASGGSSGSGAGQAIDSIINGGSNRMTGVKNALTQKALETAARTNSFTMTNSGVLSDWFLHTDFGMSMQNEISRVFGGKDIYGTGGLGDWAQRKKDEISKNAETFADDWANNVVYKGLKDFFESRDANADAATRLKSGADWRLSTQGGYGATSVQNADPMNWAPSYMGGGTSLNRPSTSLPVTDGINPVIYDAPANGGGSGEQRGVSSDDLRNFNGLPEKMRQAVRTGVSGIRVTIDGQTAGRILAPYVSQEIAREIQ